MAFTQTFTPQVVTQPGSVGQTVSNGWYTGATMNLRQQAQTCPNGWQPAMVCYDVRVTAQDFHGNTSSHGWAWAWAEL